jgi:hypothetical protein
MLRSSGSTTRAARVVASLVVGLSGCARRSASGVGESAPDAADVVVLRYAAGVTELRQTTRFSVEQAGGGQFGLASFNLEAELGWLPRQQQLEISWSTVAATDVELAGTLALGSDDDPGEILVEHGKGAYLIDRKGDRDELASMRLAANEPFQRALRELRAGDASALARAQLLSWLPVALALPELPEPELEPGKRTSYEEGQEIELEGEDGLIMPATVTRTHTLVKLDTRGASPIAEVSAEVISSGLVETDGGTLSIEGVARSTLLFDLARGLPVSLDLTRTEAFDFAGRVGESTTLIETAWW